MDASSLFRMGLVLLCWGAGVAEAAAAEGAAPAVPQTAADLYAVAVGHYARGDWKLADSEFARFLHQHPDHPQSAAALFFRAETLVQQGRHAEAKTAYLAFVEREPRHRFTLQARFRAVEAAYFAETAETAQPALEQFLAEYPQNEFDVYVRKYLAELALAARDGPRAAKLFEQVLQRDPDGPLVDESRFGLGRALELQGDIESARIAYQTLAAAHGPLADDAQIQSGICLYNHGRYGQAAALFQAAIERFPDSELLAHARYWLGMCSVAEHDWKQAATTLRDALEQHPQHALAPAMTFWLADTLRQDGDWPAADENYARVVRDWPHCEWADEALQLQIQGALAESRFERVVSLGEQFRASFPDSPFRDQVAQYLGRGYLKQQQYAQAIETLKPLIERTATPPSPDASNDDSDAPPADGVPDAAGALPTVRYYLGLAYLGDRQYQAALDCLGQVQVSPEQAEMYGGVLLAQAMALSGLNRPADAIEPLRRYLAAQPQGADALACRVQLLDSLLQGNRLDEAFLVQAELSAAELLEPACAAATHRLAEAAFVAGKNEQASRLFGSLASDGQQPEWAAKGWLGLGWAQFREGAAEAAGEAFGQVLERYPDSPLAPEAAMLRAKTLEQRDRSEDALDAYLAVAAAYGDSNQAAPAMMEAVRLLERLERKEEVVPLLRRLIQQHPGFERLDAALYELAWQLDAQGEGAEAERLFQRISDQYPDGEYWADTTYRLAERAARAAQYERAVRWLDRLIEARCADEILMRALYLRGQLAASTQRWQDVAPPLLALLEQFPDSTLRAHAACWIAESLYQQKDYTNAARWFEELEAAPLAEDDAWNAMIPLRRALMLTEQQKWPEAAALVRDLETRFPAFGQQYEVDYVLGLCLARQDQPAEALRRLERVIRSPEGGRSETAAKAQWLIGGIYAAGGELDQALKAYYRVETLYHYPPWKAAALLQAGHCHELRGEHADAARAWRHVVANFAETPAAAEAADRLEQLNAKLAGRGAAPSSVPSSARRRTLGEP